jgi:hypothetical protein
MCAIGYEVYHHPPCVQIGLHNIGCKCKLINFNLCNLRIYIEDPHFLWSHCFLPPLYKDKFCGVPSRATVKVRCVVGKKKMWNSA